MQNVHQAVAALGEAIGMTGVAFDASGDLTLIFDGTLTLNFHRIDDGSFELWVDLPDLGNTGDSGLLAAVLAANHLGEGTGPGRLALRPDRSGFVLCQRVGTAGTDAPALADAVAAFVVSATFWTSSEVRQAVDSCPASTFEAPDEGFSMIRV